MFWLSRSQAPPKRFFELLITVYLKYKMSYYIDLSPMNANRARTVDNLVAQEET